MSGMVTGVINQTFGQMKLKRNYNIKTQMMEFSGWVSMILDNVSVDSKFASSEMAINLKVSKLMLIIQTLITN